MIQAIVEGDGDVPAVPVLLRRLGDRLGAPGVQVGRPIRGKRSQLISEAGLKDRIRLALKRPDCRAILVVFDADDDCPKNEVPDLINWAQAEAGPTPVAIVLAKKEYEGWFIAGMEALRGQRGIRDDAVSHPDPESKRDAKGYLEEQMAPDRYYVEKSDQPALTARFDMDASHAKCRSFRKLVKDVQSLLAADGHGVTDWTAASAGAPALGGSEEEAGDDGEEE